MKLQIKTKNGKTLIWNVEQVNSRFGKLFRIIDVKFSVNNPLSRTGYKSLKSLKAAILKNYFYTECTIL